MKRVPSARAPSPTNTMFSGISNYRSDQYRPLRDKSRTPSGPIDPKAIAKIHYDEMANYLENHLAKEPANARASAREKLTRLTRQQFQELSTDVYDELLRRNNNANNEVPFLPVRDDFHPKRNQARQKLATLPKTRFKDLSGDVFHELGRRYPEFREPETLQDPTSPTSNYDDLDIPSPDFPQSSKNINMPRSVPTDSGYAGSSRRPSEDSYRRPSEEGFRRRPSEDAYGGNRSEEGIYGATRRPSEDSFAGSSRRKPSQDIVSSLRNEERRRPSPDIALSGRRSGEDDRDLARRPSGSVSTTSDSTNATNAQREVIIPNKSTIAEEEIEVPYARERESSSTAVGERNSRSPDVRDRTPDFRGDTDGEGITDSSARSPQLEVSGLGGLSGLTARLRDRTLDEDDEDWSGQNRSGEDYFDKMSFGRTSVASDRSAGGAPSRASASMNTGRMSKTGGTYEVDLEALRREYEYKIATMQSRITTLERSLEDAEERGRRFAENDNDEKTKVLEEESKLLREKEEELDNTIRELRRELNDERQERREERDAAAARQKRDQEEIENLRLSYERLEAERAELGAGADPETIEQLRSDMEGLLSELADLSHRNDELMIAKESDMHVIHNLDMQLKEYKRKYETAKTELRSFKATSQMFLKATKPDADQLPMSPDGGILDIHITTFVTATDNLLSAGRSHVPSRVLTPMKAVVNAVSAIIDDVRACERRQEVGDSDNEHLRALRERAEATLSNLVAASKTHATSMGMSPVSLLDAASSHLSATITELAKMLSIRKATKAEQDQFDATYSTGATSPFAPNGFVPTLRSIGEIRSSSTPTHQRAGSSSSQRRANESPSPVPLRYPPESSSSIQSPPPNPSSLSNNDSRRRPMSPSSSIGSSPPPLFDQARSNATASDDSAPAEGPEEAWAELKPYLEAQSESIVYAIQSVLSGVRSPTPTPALNENLTQIITIVSSIVAVCKDSLPPSSGQAGGEILRELSEHANRLSEVQSMSEVTKDSRQVMAKSSFAIANAMKGLMKL
ncbi:SPA2 [Sanghuangporus vaninii]